MVYLFGLIILITALVNIRLLFRIIIIVSVGLPTSYLTTHVFSLSIAGFHVLYTDFLVGIAIISWLIHSINKSKREKKSKTINSIQKLIFLLLIWNILEVIRGLLIYSNISLIFYDSRPIFYYAIILIVIDTTVSRQDIIKATRAFIVGLIIYSFITIFFIFFHSSNQLALVMQSMMTHFLGRIAFQNDFYFVFAFPLLIFIFRFTRKRHTKIIVLLVAVLFIAKVIISMSRTLSVLVVLSSMFSVFASNEKVNIFSNFFKNSKKMIFLTIIATILLVSVKIVLTYVFKYNFDAFLSTYLGRFTNYNTNAFEAAQIMPRKIMFLTGFREALSSAVFGHGYGYLFEIKGWDVPISFIDSSWITIMIRMGIIGLLIILTIIIKYSRFLSISLRNLNFRIDPQLYIYIRSLQIGGGFFLIISLVNSLMVNSTVILPLLILISVGLSYIRNFNVINNDRRI